MVQGKTTGFKASLVFILAQGVDSYPFVFENLSRTLEIQSRFRSCLNLSLSLNLVLLVLMRCVGPQHEFRSHPRGNGRFDGQIRSGDRNCTAAESEKIQ